MASLFKINGTTIKTPTEFKDEFYRITKSNRLQNGTMSMEMIAKKKKFYLKYECLTTEEKDLIYSLIWNPWNPFYRFEWLDDDRKWKSCTVYSGALSKTVHKAFKNGQWVWKDFELRLIEV